jgi:hypothetical protein
VREENEVSPTEKLEADRGHAFCFTDLGTKSVKAFLVKNMQMFRDLNLSVLLYIEHPLPSIISKLVSTA